MTMLTIPRGRAAVSEDAAARKRREVREKLLRGEVVKVSQSGTIRGQNDPAPNTEPAIEVPEGKLAAGFQRIPEIIHSLACASRACKKCKY